MSDSVRSRVLDAVVAMMAGAGLVVYRCRFSPFEADELPATNVVPDDEGAQYDSAGQIDLSLRFTVRHTAASADGAEKLVDAQYVAGQKAILAEPTLGGLVTQLRYVGSKWEFERGELDTVALVVMYEAEFSSSRSDPSSPGY